MALSDYRNGPRDVRKGFAGCGHLIRRTCPRCHEQGSGSNWGKREPYTTLCCPKCKRPKEAK